MIGREPTLREGDVIEFGGKRWRVDQVNACAARCVPLTKREIEINGRSFKAKGDVTYISPWSEVEIIKRRKARRKR